MKKTRALLLRYLRIKIQETLRTINIMELSEALNGTINIHRVHSKFTSGCQKYPVRIFAAQEYLQNKNK